MNDLKVEQDALCFNCGHEKRQHLDTGCDTHYCKCQIFEDLNQDLCELNKFGGENGDKKP